MWNDETFFLVTETSLFLLRPLLLRSFSFRPLFSPFSLLVSTLAEASLLIFRQILPKTHLTQTHLSQIYLTQTYRIIELRKRDREFNVPASSMLMLDIERGQRMEEYCCYRKFKILGDFVSFKVINVYLFIQFD